ncbi:unnamed protein product, partial [Amoebophrya sp. A25]
FVALVIRNCSVIFHPDSTTDRNCIKITAGEVLIETSVTEEVDKDL